MQLLSKWATMWTRSRGFCVSVGAWLALAAAAPIQAGAATCYWDGTTNGWTTAHWTNPVDGGPLQSPGVGTNYVATNGVVQCSTTAFVGDDLMLNPGGTLSFPNAGRATNNGTITFNGGTLDAWVVNSGRSLGAGGGYIVSDNTTSTVSVVGSIGLSLLGPLTGAGTLNKVGANGVSFGTFSPSFTGTVNVSEGSVSIFTLMPDAYVNINTNGFLYLPSNITSSNNHLRLDGGTIYKGSGNHSWLYGAMTVAGDSYLGTVQDSKEMRLGMVLGGSGNLTFAAGASNYVLVTGFSSAAYTGALAFAVSEGRLTLNSVDCSVGGLASAAIGYGTVTGPGTLTLQPGADKAYDFSGVLANLALTMAGSGTQTLSGVNTFAGALTIGDGTLLVNGTVGAGAIVTNVGGTLGGTGTVQRSVLIQSGATLSPGAPAMGTLTAINLTMQTNSTAAFDLGAPNGIYDSVAVASNLTFESGVKLRVTPRAGFGGGTYTLFTCGGTLSGEPALQPIEGGYSAKLTSGGGRVELAVRPRGSQVVVR